MEVSFDNGSTWIQSRNVTFEVIQLGDASFQATLQKGLIEQGRDLVIELSESEHIDYYYLSWESGYNPNQPHFDGNSQEIRISTLGMKPGLHDVFIGAQPQPGYQTPEPINAFITIAEKNLAEDYTISLTGEQTRNIRLIGVNISAWYQGRVLSSFSDSCWVDDVAEFVSFSASRDACKPNEEITCTLSIFRDLSNALIVAGEESYQLDTNRLYDGAEHEQTVIFTQPGTYTTYARICLSDGTWVNTDPVIISVSEVWSEPTYSWEGFVCTARAVNQEDENQVLEETVIAEKIITLSPTQQTVGAYSLRASFENAVFSVQEKEGNDIPALKDLEVLVLPADLKRIDAEAFSGIKAQAVILPDGCRTIEAGAFSGCEQLIYAYIPSSVISIGEGAFEKTVILDFGK